MLDPFQLHLVICTRCRMEPFNLCPIGAQLLLVPEDTPEPSVTRYVAQLRTPSLWFAEPNKWLDDAKQATRYPTLDAAEQATAPYDVIIRTVEEEA